MDRTVAFRVDSSSRIGAGHAMRCLALARLLHAGGWKVVFVCRDLVGSLNHRIEDAGFPVCTLPETEKRVLDARDKTEFVSLAGADDSLPWGSEKQILDARDTVRALSGIQATIHWVIVDHYGLDAGWESQVRDDTKAAIFAIDDLANRAHDCALLLDQNFTLEEDRYRGRIPADARFLGGPSYALLREEFAVHARQARARRRTGRDHVLISFGGGSPSAESDKCAKGLVDAGGISRIDAIPGTETMKRAAQDGALHPSIHLYDFVADMASLMSVCDLSFGAGGITTWERMCVGLPAVVTTIAQNQELSARDLAVRGYILWLGRSDETTARSYRNAYDSLSTETLRRMAESGMELVDGRGCARVVEAMLAIR